ncbi:MAG: c-type cytochrome [Verrucomicrobia bacterium]|jgi:cytochrome c2|nr:c-type cytochrome [Verrucomicrobiota bacterium]
MNGRIFKWITSLVVLVSFYDIHAGNARGWGEFVEPGFPYISATVDARSIDGGALEDNLIVRGVIVFLGNDTYACYDTDLVRLGVVWKGGFLDYKSMATHTYYNQGKKNHGGQEWVSKPQGDCITANGLYPGAQSGRLITNDPRPAGPDPREIGRGPLDASIAEWKGVHVVGEQAVIKYTVQDVNVAEMIASVPADRGRGYVRSLSIGAHSSSISIVLGDSLGQVLQEDSTGRVGAQGGMESLNFQILEGTGGEIQVDDSGLVVLKLSPSLRQRQFDVVAFRGDPSQQKKVFDQNKERDFWFPDVTKSVGLHWEETVLTRGRLGRESGFAIDEITLPSVNPWKRQVRVADVAFLPDESVAVVTFDGDVWVLSDIGESLDALRWRRIASGLHEPQSINHRDGKLFVYTRNGLIRLHDLNRDGEIDFYETFSNRFTQTAETREFPNDSVVTRDGGFLLAKPGQQGAHQGLHNGSILHVSPDGKTVRQIASGFRQPYLGYRASNDLITASDQQGHWVPTTPIQWVRENRHYGFRPSSELVPPSLPTTAPIVWIPHRVVQSATSQVWVDSDKMGPLSGRLVCLDYYRANLMLVHFDDDEAPVQGAVSGLTLPVDLPVLKGDVSPHDGWLYLSGFQIWGSTAKPWSGIRRVRYVGGDVNFPTKVRSVKEGVILGFDAPLDRSSANDLANYHVGRWNYRRTKNYGSGYYKLDGEPGTEVVGVSGVVLSSDAKSALLAIPDMKPVMQMEVVYRVRKASGREIEGAAHATVHENQEIDLAAEGFSLAEIGTALKRELPTASSADRQGEVTAALGQELYQTMGCMACHSLDGTTAGRSGPTLRGVFGTMREFQKGKSREANEAYIRESILNPPKNILKAFATSDIGMPSYEGILSDSQIDSLVLFIRSLSE